MIRKEGNADLHSLRGERILNFHAALASGAVAFACLRNIYHFMWILLAIGLFVNLYLGGKW